MLKDNDKELHEEFWVIFLFFNLFLIFFNLCILYNYYIFAKITLYQGFSK